MKELHKIKPLNEGEIVILKHQNNLVLGIIEEVEYRDEPDEPGHPDAEYKIKSAMSGKIYDGDKRTTKLADEKQQETFFKMEKLARA